jgi:hypothetical protein
MNFVEISITNVCIGTWQVDTRTAEIIATVKISRGNQKYY